MYIKALLLQVFSVSKQRDLIYPLQRRMFQKVLMPHLLSEGFVSQVSWNKCIITNVNISFDISLTNSHCIHSMGFQICPVNIYLNLHRHWGGSIVMIQFYGYRTWGIPSWVIFCRSHKLVRNRDELIQNLLDSSVNAYVYLSMEWKVGSGIDPKKCLLQTKYLLMCKNQTNKR